MGASSFDCIIIVNGTVHKHGLVLSEGSALFGLVQDIYPHHFSGAILYHEVPLLNAISNEEISSIDVLGLFGAGESSVHLKPHCGLVVLVHDHLLFIITLCFNEVSAPQCSR